MNLSKFNEYEYFDYYDHEKVEKLQEKRSFQWLKLYKKLMDAKKKGDEKALDKAKEAIRQHETQDQFIKEKARATGFYWY